MREEFLVESSLAHVTTCEPHGDTRGDTLHDTPCNYRVDDRRTAVTFHEGRSSMSRSRTVAHVPIIALAGLGALLSGCNTATQTPPKPSPTKTEIVSYSFSPASPATLKFGENVTATLTYTSVNT